MRRIDRKFAVDGDRIIKTTNGEVLPPEEPLFLFRARDHLALPALRAYLAMCEADGCTGYQLDEMRAIIEEFEQFKRQHADRMKQPGCTLGK
jgi:hypothetical protein